MCAQRFRTEPPRRVAVLGNGGGGKSTLAAALAAGLGLPWCEVDRLQFDPGWERVPLDALRARLAEVTATARWVIDGFGPWDSIEARCARADLVILVDLPIWMHFWWAAERQIDAALGRARLGGPDGCDLREVNREMFETLWRVHVELRPRLVALLERVSASGHAVTHHVTSPEALDALRVALVPPDAGPTP